MKCDGRSIAELIAARLPGHALDQAFYVRDDVYARDIERLNAGWTCLGHESEIPEAGDWITGGFGRESAIVVRGEDGVVRALANVCRHRGSRICVQARGGGVALTCPYHAWSYHLDGRLRSAREMGEAFEPSRYGLTSLPLTLIGGLILVSFDQAPPALDAAAPALAAMTRLHRWDRAKIAHRATYAVAANWKLAVENYHECYHCAPAHPEFSVLHSLARPNARRLRSPGEASAEVDIEDFEDWAPEGGGREIVRVMHSGLLAGAQTGSQDGALVAPPMGAARSGQCVFAELGYLSAFLAYADHGVIYRFIPMGMLDTRMEVIWLVDGEAREGADYSVEALTWLWDITSRADKTIIERNQAGVLSQFYRPGPFSLMEPGAAQFVSRYLADLSSLDKA